MPPAEKFGTGSFPALATILTSSYGARVLWLWRRVLLRRDGEDFHLLHNLANVLDGVDYVAGAGFALGADHGGAFGDAAQGFAQVAGAADEGDFEGVLVDVVGFVGGSEDFGFVDVVDAEFLENLGFGKMSDAAFRHDRDGDGGHDLANLFGRGHAGYAAFGADLRRDALKGHHGDGAGLFRDGGLLGVGDIHDDAAFEHFGEAGLQAEAMVLEPLFCDMGVLFSEGKLQPSARQLSAHSRYFTARAHSRYPSRFRGQEDCRAALGGQRRAAVPTPIICCLRADR